ncbi:hypothetical protein C4585_02380 [Candidatus Parcubacteria bacterium]|nr:MAG: hypothetical protein C4585_02380 [Candidatus Parcubacteria bacterium]
MANIRIAFHAANPEVESTFRRFGYGLNGHRASIVRDEKPRSDVQFFFGSIFGTPSETQAGIDMLRYVQENISLFGKKIATALFIDESGYRVLKNAGLDPNPIRLVIGIGDLSEFPSTAGLAHKSALRACVGNVRWTEDELARMRMILDKAINPFYWGAM